MESRTMRRLFGAFSIVAIIAAGPTVATAKQLVILGDSLSDTGNLAVLSGGTLPPSPLYDPGRKQRFSNGDIWTDVVADEWGLTVTQAWQSPSLGDGIATNYAVANAFTGSYEWAGSIGAGLPRIDNFTDLIGTTLGQPFQGVPGLSQQLGLYLSHGVAGDATHVVWAGANDLFFSNQLQPVSAPSVVEQAVANIESVLNTLYAQGADKFIVANLPDLGATPFAAGVTQFPISLPDRRVELTQLTDAYNQLLADMLDDLLFDVHLVDIAGLFNAALADPAAFGFTNSSQPCLDLATLASQCGTPESYLFWDEVHPTTVAHGFIGSAFASAIPEPPPILMLAAGLLLVTFRCAHQKPDSA